MLRECADLVPGTAAAGLLGGLADAYGPVQMTLEGLRKILRSASANDCYCADGRAALALAAEEIAR